MIIIIGGGYHSRYKHIEVNMWWICLFLAPLVEVGRMDDEATRTRSFRIGRLCRFACYVFKCNEVTRKAQFSSNFRVFHRKIALASDRIENS